MSVERQLMMCAGGATQQYTISNSLRFRASASAYLSRTPASAGNRQTWTWSAWIKRGILGSRQSLLDGYDASAGHVIEFSASDTLQMYSWGGPSALDLNTTQVFRDPSAWYHFVVAVDTTQATASNRIKFYVNGTQITSFSSATYPPQNEQLYINNNVLQDIGRRGSNQFYFDGYLTEVNFIGGQALTPSSFGETSSTTGVWIPKKYTGSYGTNGFYLNFSNNTSTTALGYDTSGNGNNWTPNNFSLTTGSTYDSMIDSPTSYASGANNVGNYAVLNPLQVTAANIGTISNGNLSWSCGAFATYGKIYGSIPIPSTGKFYWEVTADGTANLDIGIIAASDQTTYYPGYSAKGYVYYQSTGQKVNNNTYSTYGASYTTNDVIGVAFDADAGTLSFYKNNVSQGVAFTGLTGTVYTATLGNEASSGSAAAAINFGQRPFAYTPPSGYNALNTYNLSTPSIVDGSKQFAASLYIGTGSSLSVSGANFTPGMVWVKSRSAATDHALYDVIRGTQARLESNTTDAEVTSDNGVTAFNSTGFTVGTLAQVNTSSATYVGWQWKANGTAVTNTAGSITSSVSANQTAGFSVVTYTGNGVTSATVGHGLGVTPAMLIVKDRTTTHDWFVWQQKLSSGYQLRLNLTIAQEQVSSATNLGGLGTPTSTTFGFIAGLVNTDNVNQSGNTYVAYCFAAIPGYSAFGSYTGNGSNDGPFVYTGFRPRWVVIKSSSAVGEWRIYDTSRSPYNAANGQLYADLSNAEGVNSAYAFDMLSNGFKTRNLGTGLNTNGVIYIYACFAENPFKYSLAR